MTLLIILTAIEAGGAGEMRGFRTAGIFVGTGVAFGAEVGVGAGFEVGVGGFNVGVGVGEA